RSPVRRKEGSDMTKPDARRLRRTILLAGAALMTPTAWARLAPVQVDVWKSPTCGCCKDWVAHMEAAGFRVNVHETGNAAMRERLGIPVALGSCHTARVAGY